jgi:hypothetical protein
MNSSLSELPANTFDFLKNNPKVLCSTHKTQAAKTLCQTCKVFCCMIENCAQPHIYHDMQNLDYLVNNLLTPTVFNFFECRSQLKQEIITQRTNLNQYRNNLKAFVLEEKKRIDHEYRSLLNELSIVYNSYMEDLNIFTEGLNSKFEEISSNIDGNIINKNNPTLQEIEESLKSAVNNSQNSFEKFIQVICPITKQLQTKVNQVKGNLNKFDFYKEIAEIKQHAEKEYEREGFASLKNYFTNLSKVVKEEVVKISELRKKKEEREVYRRSMSKMRRMVSLIPGDDINPQTLNIDLDIFVRNISEMINSIRKDSSECIKIISEFYEQNDPLNQTMNMMNQSNMLNDTMMFINNQNPQNQNTKLTSLFEYVSFLQSQNFQLKPFEWDNDLSNSAEEYLKIFNGKLEKEKDLKQHMVEFIHQSYSEYKNINTFSYHGIPNIGKIIVNILLSEKLFDILTKHNIIYDEKFNVLGISAVPSPYKNSQISLIINFAHLDLAEKEKKK